MKNKQANRRRINIEHRLGVLTQALRALIDDPGTGDAARRLITSIRSSCELHGMQRASSAARLAEQADPDRLPSRMEELIHALREELYGTPAESATVLVVTTDLNLAHAATTALAAPARRIEVVGSARDALARMAASPVAAVILDTVLHGEDGRELLVALRSLPAFSALPIVALFPRLCGQAASFPLAVGADLSLPKPADLQQMADFLQVRLKRGREAVREARRDPLTGLLNRGAFCELFDGMMSRRTEQVEPVALGLLAIENFDVIADMGPIVSDDVIRQAGSLLSSAFRATDSLARWGESEFIVLLPGEDQFGGSRAVEKALRALNTRPIATPMGKSVTLRLVAAVAVFGDRTTLDAASERLDQLLLSAFRMLRADSNAPPLATDTPAGLLRIRMGLCTVDPTLPRLIQTALGQDTSMSVAVFNPSEALRSLREDAYDLLVIDGAQTGTPVADIMSAIRSLPDGHRPPALVLVDSEESAAAAMDQGASDYAVRPPDIRSVMFRIRRLLRRIVVRTPDRPRFLIVDSEVPQLLVAGTTLHQHGCGVALARGVGDALDRLPSLRPDYLILNIQMPGLADSGFMESVKSMPQLRRMVILPAADWSKPHAVPATDPLPVRARLSRPYKPGTLMSELREATGIADSGHAANGEDRDFQSEVQRIMTTEP